MDSSPADGNLESGSKGGKQGGSKDDYEVVDSAIGRGAYGRVHLVRKNGKLFAMKEIEKKKLAKEKKQYQAFVERELLMKINHPGIIKLNKCFQDAKYLCYILEYCDGGDLTKLIKTNQNRLTDELRIFYVAQIVSILQYLHQAGITHRDLKPENIMLTREGHLKVIDFGTAEITKCTIVDQKFKDDIAKQKQQANNLSETNEDEDSDEDMTRKRKSTFVGTSYYLSPELLEKNICEPPADLWALGCIIYQLYYFTTPFQAGNQYQVFENIKNAKPKFPKTESANEDANDLIRRLLLKNPEDRLGSGCKEGLSLKDLKSHPYFKEINFESIFDQQVPQLPEDVQEKNEEKKTKLQEVLASIKNELDEGNILIQGMIERRRFFSYESCYLIVYKDLRSVEIVSEGFDHRRQMMLSSAVKKPAQLLSGNKFRLWSNDDRQTFRITGEAEKWTEVINQRSTEL